jgi:schlafen family protein
MRRIELLLNSSLAELGSGDLESLVASAIPEESDLEYKSQLYGSSDSEKRDLAGDVAAMANGVGGVIIVGVVAADGIPTRLAPVELSEKEDLRMRQTITALVAPAPQVTIYRLRAETNSLGYYLIGVPRSPDAPHAVRVNEALRYPRRDGPRIRWLSESEVADEYRSRFQRAESQVSRLARIYRDGKSSIDLNTTAWIALAMVPLSPGQMVLRQKTISEARSEWIGPWTGGFGADVFDGGGFQVSAGLGRVIISAGREREDSRSRTGHAELYQDGSGFAATRLWIPRQDRESRGVEIDDERLTLSVIATLSILVDHAVRRAGCVGDAIVQASIEGPLQLGASLTFIRQDFIAAIPGTRKVQEISASQRQLNFEDCRSGPGILIAVRMLMTDLVQSFGAAEVLQITPTGQLRRLYFNRASQSAAANWAQGKGVQVVETTIEAEP